MKRLLQGWFLALAGVPMGCHQTELTDANRQLAASAGVPMQAALALAEAGSRLRRLEGVDAEGHHRPLPGLTVDVPHARSKAAVRGLRSRLPSGYLAFVSDQAFGIGNKPDTVSVMAASSFLDVVAGVGTAGWNYDLDTAAVASRLREWDRRYGLLLIGAGDDWFEAEFSRPPPDLGAFAREVYAFCPDVVDQGTETVEALAAEMKRSNTLYLWWD